MNSRLRTQHVPRHRRAGVPSSRTRLMTLVAAVSLGLTALCMLAVPALLVLTSGVLPPATYALAIQLGYWMMPQIFFSALYVMCGQQIGRAHV